MKGLTVKIKDDIFWVGVIDWDIRDMHDYFYTYKGTTYNSYLIMDEKITLFDTVKSGFSDDYLRNIGHIIDPHKIDYIIVNHVEMDHTGILPEIMEIVKPEKLFCSPMGKKALLSHFHRDDWPYEVVETGKTIRLGRRTVKFIEGRMLHWPDSMLSYICEDRMLISNDVFGQHWATSERFDDEVDHTDLIRHMSEYFANIFLPYSDLVLKLLEKINEMKLDIEIIAPDHGIILRSDPSGIMNTYERWSRQEGGKKALIIYDTMYYNTEKMAKAIGEGLLKNGIDIRSEDSVKGV